MESGYLVIAPGVHRRSQLKDHPNIKTISAPDAALYSKQRARKWASAGRLPQLPIFLIAPSSVCNVPSLFTSSVSTGLKEPGS